MGLLFIGAKAVKTTSGVVTAQWVEEIKQRQQIVQQLADEFAACFVPFQAALDYVLPSASAAYWATDGVHPTLAGHRVLAECWYATVTDKKLAQNL